MDTHQILTLAAMLVVLVGAIIPALSLDVAAILAVGLLVLGGVLLPGEAVQGFGSTTLVVVAGMFVLAEALQRTGAAQGIATLVERASTRGQRWLMICLLPVVMLLSGIMNNTGVVVLLLPLLVAACQEIKVSPSRVLLPLSYASIVGGTLTLVGTTTTLLVDGIVRQQLGADAGIAFFEILPIGIVFCARDVRVPRAVGPALLPNRTGLVDAGEHEGHAPVHDQPRDRRALATRGPQARRVPEAHEEDARAAARARRRDPLAAVPGRAPRGRRRPAREGRARRDRQAARGARARAAAGRRRHRTAWRGSTSPSPR